MSYCSSQSVDLGRESNRLEEEEKERPASSSHSRPPSRSESALAKVLEMMGNISAELRHGQAETAYKLSELATSQSDIAHRQTELAHSQSALALNQTGFSQRLERLETPPPAPSVLRQTNPDQSRLGRLVTLVAVRTTAAPTHSQPLVTPSSDPLESEFMSAQGASAELPALRRSERIKGLPKPNYLEQGRPFQPLPRSDVRSLTDDRPLLTVPGLNIVSKQDVPGALYKGRGLANPFRPDEGPHSMTCMASS